ncbi:MAG: hypothetical protein ABIC04_01195 [Nanoarchaeota archaeon]
MFEFNPDGSIKLPELLRKNNEEIINKLRTQRCIKIKRKIVSYTAPKKCILDITLSDAITDNRFIENIYKYLKSTTPTKITKLSEKEFEIEVGTDFRRCSDCNSIINQYREFLEGNIVEEKGSCTYEGRKSFCYEDYFE